MANTAHGPGGHRHARPGDAEGDHDHLVDPEDARRFLADHAVPVPAGLPGERHLAALREVRRVARGLPASTAGLRTSALEPLLSAARYRLSIDGTIGSDAAGWDGLVADLLPRLLELALGPAQLKVCGNDACRFLFLDRSRNRSRVWCEMAVCGNRAKVSRFRHRHDTAESA